jgi:DNA-binding transcriptional LysR family regulator
MDLAQLETFIAIVEERGFSRAALRLHRTQPAISQAIRRLEDELGERLFERGSRDGTLTAAGGVLRDYAERMLRLRTEAASAVDELRALERGRLLIAANEYTSHLLLPLLAAYRQTSPQIEIQVQRALASRIPEQVAERSVELGVLSFLPEQSSLQAIAVYDDDVSLVVDPSHPLAGTASVPISELGAQNFIGHAVPSPLRRRVTALFVEAKTPLHMGVQLPSLEAVKQFVALGAGVAILPGLAVRRDVERGDLVRVHVPELAWKRRLWLIHRRQSPLSHAAAAFARTLRVLAAESGDPHLYLPV